MRIDCKNFSNSIKHILEPMECWKLYENLIKLFLFSITSLFSNSIFSTSKCAVPFLFGSCRMLLVYFWPSCMQTPLQADTYSFVSTEKGCPFNASLNLRKNYKSYGAKSETVQQLWVSAFIVCNVSWLFSNKFYLLQFLS